LYRFLYSRRKKVNKYANIIMMTHLINIEISLFDHDFTYSCVISVYFLYQNFSTNSIPYTSDLMQFLNRYPLLNSFSHSWNCDQCDPYKISLNGGVIYKKFETASRSHLNNFWNFKGLRVSVIKYFSNKTIPSRYQEVIWHMRPRRPYHFILWPQKWLLSVFWENSPKWKQPSSGSRFAGG